MTAPAVSIPALFYAYTLLVIIDCGSELANLKNQ